MCGGKRTQREKEGGNWETKIMGTRLVSVRNFFLPNIYKFSYYYIKKILRFFKVRF